MVNKIALVLIAVFASLTAMPFLAAPTLADDPTCFTEKVIPIPPTGAAVAYLVIDTNTGNQWLYVESNNQPGLQRGGAGPGEPAFQTVNGAVSSVFPDGVIDDTDTCQQSATPDTLVF